MKKICTLLLALLFFGLSSHAQMRYLKGTLQGSQEVPPVASPGGGVVIVKYNITTKFLELIGNYRNLTSVATASHIHVAPPGTANPTPLIPLTNTAGTSGTLNGTSTLTTAQEADLLAGNMYVNVHTTNFPAGELRAQLTLATADRTLLLTARLQGAQEVPPNSSTATGMANALLDTATNMFYITGNYSGLTTAVISAHVHRGALFVAGPVSFPLNFTAATSGVLDTSVSVSASLRDSIVSGNSYVNVHTSTYTGGEIRGQLTMLDQLVYFAGNMSGANEVPANASTAKGVVIVRYNTVSNALELVGDYQNLSSTISGSHIHGPAGPGANAPVLFTLTNSGGTTGTLTGSATLSDAQEIDLLAGNMYVNIHSTNFTGGEIRTQLIQTTSGQTAYLTTRMDPAQEPVTPPVVSSGSGTSTVLLDQVTRNIFVTGSYSGLTTGITNSHIHRGPVGVNGPVSINLNFVTGTMAGTVNAAATISATLVDSIINGMSYVNIHTTNFPAGEIRGQLGNITLPVKLSYFNGFKDRNLVTLMWESGQEINVKSYEIEQQNTQTGDWIRKGSVSARGTGAATKYSFDDLPVGNNKDYVLYRLKILDADGKTAYSPVIRINYNQTKLTLTIAPNPVVTNRLRFTITGASATKKAEISVMDFNGRTILKTTGSALLNNVIDVSRLSAGMYKLVIRTGDTILQETFSKQ